MTTKAPVVELVELVVVVMEIFPSTFKLFAILTPPEIIRAAPSLEKSVISVILVGLLILTKSSPSVLKVKFPVVDLIVFPSISILFTFNFSIVAAIPTFNVSVSVCPTSSSLTVPIPALKLLKVTSAF